MIRDPELKLLLNLCGSAVRAQRCREASGSSDWPRLVRLARRHRVQGLAWIGLTGGTESELPQAVELFEDAKAIVQQNLLAITAATRLLDEFKKQRLPLVFLKGLTMGALAYPNAMLKMSTDIDVLVDPQEIEAAEHCLEELGYQPEGERRSGSRKALAAKEWMWVGTDGMVIDLHARLADNPALLQTVGARSLTQDVQISPGIALPTLRREALFAYLCVHGTSSAWFRLKWVADLAALLNRCSAGEMRSLWDASRSYDTGRCPDVALLVVEGLFGPLIPSDLLSKAASDPIARLLARLSIREIVQSREPLERPMGTVLIHLCQLFIGRGLGFPLRDFRRQFSALVG